MTPQVLCALTQLERDPGMPWRCVIFGRRVPGEFYRLRGRGAYLTDAGRHALTKARSGQ